MNAPAAEWVLIALSVATTLASAISTFVVLQTRAAIAETRTAIAETKLELVERITEATKETPTRGELETLRRRIDQAERDFTIQIGRCAACTRRTPQTA